VSAEALIRRGLKAGWRMATFDREGLHHFDLTVEGFWQSFLAIPLSLPLVLAPLALPGTYSLKGVLLDMVGTALGWIVVLAVMLAVSRVISRSHRFSAFVIAYNWTEVLLRVAALAVSMAAGLMGGGAALLILLLVWAYASTVTWYVLKESLEIETGLAIVLLILLSLLELLLDYAFGALVSAVS
jgi:hypothetical protein